MKNKPIIRDNLSPFDVRMKSKPEELKDFYEIIDSMEIGQSAKFECDHPRGFSSFCALISSRCNSYQSVRTGYKLERRGCREENSVFIFKRKSGKHQDLSRFNCSPLVLRENGFSTDQKRRSIFEPMEKNGPEFYEPLVQRVRHLKAFKVDSEPTKKAREMISNMVNAGALNIMPCGRIKIKGR